VRDRIANVGHICGHSQPGPIVKKYRVAFFVKNLRVNVMGVGQAVRLRNGAAHCAQIGWGMIHLGLLTLMSG
jgi:hypothetical protein